METVMDNVFVGDQVFLRGLEWEDLYLRPKWFNDPEINHSLLMDFPISLASTKAWFQRSLQKDNTTNLSICCKETERVIGMTGILNCQPLHMHGQFYITIGEKEFWGRKIADEVIPMVLFHGFKALNLNKIYLWTTPINDRARRVYERNGFVIEAEMKEQYYCRGGFQDIIQHRVLRKEWDDQNRHLFNGFSKLNIGKK